MRYVDLACANCGKPFQKAKNEYDRRCRAGVTEFYCGLSCVAFAANRNHPHNWVLPPKLGQGRKTDPFRWYVARARYRKHHGPHDLTVEYLKDLWAAQGGRCPLTGWDLTLPHNTLGWRSRVDRNKRASLDRIDSSKGYVQGNVRFVAVMANYMRSDFDDWELVEFCRAVASRAGS